MYKIDSIELRDYKRLQLSQLKLFKATFNEKNQLVIGTNGSGKSSLFHELSPLPPDNKQYEKTGKKVIKITKDGKQYTLTSTFLPKPFHSFMVDDQELNESGLITIQKELAEKHFGITDQIHELMIGKTSFTSMSVNERRAWFTKLSDANYEYLISIYLKYKDEVRDITGALRLAKNKLVAETAKQMKEEELTRIKNEVEILYKLINRLSEERIPINNSLDNILNERNYLEDEINKQLNNLNQYKYLFKENIDLHELSIDDYINQLNGKIAVYKQIEEDLFKKHNKLNEIVKGLEHSNVENTAKLYTELKSLDKEILDLTNTKTFKFTNDYPEQALDIINSIKEDIKHISDNIDTNTNKEKYNKALLQELKDNQEKELSIINTITLDINNLEPKIEHAKKHLADNTTTCPKCSYTWSKVNSKEEIDKLELKLKNLYIEKDNRNKVLLKLNEDLERFKIYSDYLKQYKNITSYTDSLKDFWYELANSSTLDIEPNQVYFKLCLYEDDLKLDLKISKLNYEKQEKLKLIELTKDSNTKDFKKIKQDLEELEVTIHDFNIEYRGYLKELDYCSKLRNNINSLKRLKTSLESLKDQYTGLTYDGIENLRRQSFNAIIRELQSILASKETILQDSNNQSRIIESLNAEIEFLTKKEKALKVGLKLLSPTEGLIAKGLFGFMKIFIANMNSIIEKIWSYPLQVLPCNADDEGGIDLTYKFPLLVSTDEAIRKDVSEGSSSMIEVVDLAFRICALKALKLNDIPLFLDEFGKAMDYTHRQATIRLINELMQQESFTQMFLISHDISQYGSLANCEICVLNDLNVILPPNSIYNKHIEMY